MSELLGYDDWLPEQTADDTDAGWGELPRELGPETDSDIQRYLEERPPHHET